MKPLFSINKKLPSALLAIIFIFMTSGDLMGQRFNGSNGGTQIPDDACGTNEVISEIEVSGIGRLNFADDKGLTVFFKVTHPYIGDVRIKLESPSGTQVIVSDQNGAGGDDYLNTTISYWSHLDPLSAGTPPYNYYFKSDEPLSTFDNEIADGTWKLIICDNAGGDVGTFDYSSLLFNTTGYARGLIGYFPIQNNMHNRGIGGFYPNITQTGLAASGSAALSTDLFNRDNEAYAFDGGGYLQTTASNTLLDPSHSDEFTIAAWVKVNDAVTDQKIVGKATPNLNNLTIYTLAIENNQFNFEVLLNGIGGNSGKIFGGTPVVGEWAHVAGTWKKNGEKRLYVNGSLVASESAPDTEWPEMTNSLFTVGAASFDPSGYRLNGSVDEIRFFNIELSAQGISDIAQASNNFCQNAVDLPVNGHQCYVSRYGTNVSGSSTGMSANCGVFSGGDVWYKVIVPASGNLNLEASQTGSVSDLVMEVYGGDCQNPTYIDCDDDNGSGNMPYLALTGQSPGAALYVRLFSYQNAQFGTFGICAYDATTTAVEDLLAPEGSLVVYPNPATAGMTNLKFESIPTGQSQVRILDLAGRLVHQQMVLGPQGEEQIDLSRFAPGMYMVELKTELGILNQKLLVE